MKKIREKPNITAVVATIFFSVILQLPLIISYGEGLLAKAIFNDLPALLALFSAAAYRLDALKRRHFLGTNLSLSYCCVLASVFFFSCMISYFMSTFFI